MTDSILQALQAANEPQEKSAILAEAIFALLPMETALAARRCVILHWFDAAIVEALLEDRELTFDEMRNVYEQLQKLPFIDTISRGLTFQNFTREGLVIRYSRTQPELLQSAARLAAPHFEMREEDKKSVMEAFFCYMVAGEREASIELQNILFEEASSRQDWQRLDSLFRVQEEAERFPFVRSLPRDEQQILLRGLIHRIQGKQEAAILDYQDALILNPRSILAYVSRGTCYVEQDRVAEALVDYNTALQLDKKFAQAYLGRGIVYTKQGKYTEALKDNSKAIRLGLSNDIVFLNKGNILNELGQYEDAIAAYDAALRLNTASVNAYVGKGQALNGIERYNDALATLEEALRLDAESVNAYISKGQALNGLERYNDALVAYEEAIRLNPQSADAYRGKGQSLSKLKRYAEASAAFDQANHLDPQQEDVTAENEDVDEVGYTYQRRRRTVTANNDSNALFGRLTKPFRSTRYSPQRRPNLFWNGVSNSFAVLTVCIIIVVSLLLFHSFTNTLIGGPNGDATATANTLISPTPTPSPTPTQISENLTLSFTDSVGVTTTNSYTGQITITVNGTGNAVSTTPNSSDAFYIFLDPSGNPVNPPLHKECWALEMFMNNQWTENFVSPTPPYDSSHSYTFSMIAPGGPLSFKICDGVYSDNGGSLNIQVTGSVSSSSAAQVSSISNIQVETISTDMVAEEGKKTVGAMIMP